jgi:hypothetical protein
VNKCEQLFISINRLLIMCDTTKEISTNDCRNSGSIHSVKISNNHRKPGEFIARNSLLTDLFRISHINCIRNAFVATIILMVSRQMINEFVHYGR